MNNINLEWVKLTYDPIKYAADKIVTGDFVRKTFRCSLKAEGVTRRFITKFGDMALRAKGIEQGMKLYEQYYDAAACIVMESRGQRAEDFWNETYKEVNEIARLFREKGIDL